MISTHQYSLLLQTPVAMQSAQLPRLTALPTSVHGNTLSTCHRCYFARPYGCQPCAEYCPVWPACVAAQRPDHQSVYFVRVTPPNPF